MNADLRRCWWHILNCWKSHVAAHMYFRFVTMSCICLTHFSRMYFPILINWTSPFQILGLLCGIFHFYSNFKGNFGKKTVKNLIRRLVLRRLIWFCTVYRCPTKRTLGLYVWVESNYFLFCSVAQQAKFHSSWSQSPRTGPWYLATRLTIYLNTQCRSSQAWNRRC